MLNSFDDEDAAAVFAAIRRPTPAASARSPSRMSPARPPSVCSRRWRWPRGRDRIAAAYVTDFVDIFEFGLRVLSQRPRGIGRSTSLAITTLHMAYLAYFPDSHIVRKHGAAVAEAVRGQAHALAPLWQPVAQRNTLPKLLDFDAELKRHNVNPGTTADLVVATVFAASICDALGLPIASLAPCLGAGALRYLVAVLKARRYPANRFGDNVTGRR